MSEENLLEIYDKLEDHTLNEEFIESKLPKICGINYFLEHDHLNLTLYHYSILFENIPMLKYITTSPLIEAEL